MPDGVKGAFDIKEACQDDLAILTSSPDMLIQSYGVIRNASPLPESSLTFGDYPPTITKMYQNLNNAFV